jgi:hypothetical protein
MKYDKYKAFPYPVLRPNSDDYKDGEFQATAEFQISQDEITVSVSYALSSEEISAQIDQGSAEYVCSISCRDTYLQQVVSTREKSAKARFEIGALRGEVRVNPYIIAKKDIPSFISPDINHEFGAGPFHFAQGDVMAQDEPQIFYIDRDMFKPITSVFDLVAKEDIPDNEWRVAFSEEHIQIEVSIGTKDIIDSARNDQKKRVVLVNSIYFAAVMQAVQKLKDSQEEFAERKWAQVIIQQAVNNGIDLNNHESYMITEQLMKHPLRALASKVLQGGSQ